jgi:uncharacterized protein (TIGR02145 family)
LTFIHFKIIKMKVRFLPFLMLPILGMAQANSNGEVPLGGNTSSERQTLEIKRNASYNLEEIKVRWKKAALENCQGAPCVSITPPGPVTSVVATPTSATSVSVSFDPPASTGGSPITGYEATATPTSSAPAKRKSSATITVKGKMSPIDIPGLTPNQNYTFSVIALNAAGISPPVTTTTTVTPCILNTAGTPSSPTVTVNSLMTPFTIATTGATGISNAGVSGSNALPSGVSAAFASNTITISGTPTATGTFNYRILLTGGCGNVDATGIITVNPIPPCPATIIYNQYTYKTVGIGNQCWMAENLRTSWYNDGNTIPDETDNSEWGNLTIGARAVYVGGNNLPTTGYVGTYGYLYNWYAVNDSKKLCPSGWHVPTDAEWTTLTNDILEGSSGAGAKMKSTGTDYWFSQSTGTDNSSEFSALPGGFRGNQGFSSIRYDAVFWSATEIGIDVWSRNLNDNSGVVDRFINNKTFGASVRCLRD